MAYQDPYQSARPGYQPQSSYHDGPEFDPYNNKQTYPPYEQGGFVGAGYRDDAPQPRPPQMTPSTSYEKGTPDDSRASFVAPPRSTGALRLWRHDEHGNLWTKGGRGRCVGRFCCCSIMTFVFLLLSIVFALGIWVRPPDITFNGIRMPTNGSTVEVTASGLTINLNLAIGVKNPNFFGVNFERIQAKAFYPVGNAEIGGGTLPDVVFKSNSNTDFLFPFQILYTDAADPDKVIIRDLVDRCGFTGNAKRPLSVHYELKLGLKIAVATISPSFNGDASFDCPLKKEDVQGLLGGLQIPGLETS